MKKYPLVVGLGLTGLSVARFFARSNQTFIAYDTRNIVKNTEPLKENACCKQILLGDFSELDWTFIDTVVASPGVSLNEEILLKAKLLDIPIISDIELFAGANKQPVIGITGTNGKSTVTTMVEDILKTTGLSVAVCGNIGEPVLDLLAKSFDVFVMELSSFQLESTYSLKLMVGCILNITPDHLDRHQTFAHYISAKKRIYMHAQTIVMNEDDKNTLDKQRDKKAVISFGKNGDCSLVTKDNTRYLAYHTKPFLAVNHLQVRGEHNYFNALAASAICLQYGLSLEEVAKGLKTFKGLPHRCQLVCQKEGVTWLNDSKGTNVDATVAAIKGLSEEIPGRLILIAGGQGKGADFAELAKYIHQYVHRVVLFGEDKANIAQAINDESKTHVVNDLDEALAKARNDARDGDTVLFSPACASFDMFKNFNERGELFMQKVMAL